MKVKADGSQKVTSFAGDVLKLVSGTTIAQIVGVLAAPLLARLYAPEAFGLLAIFTSISGIVGVIACLRYELSIMLPKTHEEAANLLGVSLGFVMITSTTTVVVLWLGREPLLRWLDAPALRPYLWLVPAAVFINGVFTALNYWNSRTRQFGRLSIARVTRSLATNSMILAAGYVGYGSGGAMIAASLAGGAVATAVLGGQICRDDRKLFRRFMRWRGMVADIIRYRKFPLYGTWAALLNSASWQLPTLLLGNFFSLVVVGYYALGLQVIQRPLNLVGSAAAQVFFQRAAEARAEGTLDSMVESVLRRLVVIGLFPMLTLTIIGQDFCTVAFGNSWRDSGVYIQILSIFMFFNFIASPLGQLFSVLERQEVSSIVNSVLFFSRLGALVWGGSTGNILFTLFLFSISGVLVYGGYSMWISSVAGVSAKQWIAILMHSIALSALHLVPAWTICNLLNLRGWSLLLIYFVAFISYYAQVAIQEPKIRLIFPRIANKLLKSN